MTDNISHPVSATALHEARGWLLDCDFDEDTLDELSDRLVVAVVDANYDGGWQQFLLAIDSRLEEHHQAAPIATEPAPPDSIAARAVPALDDATEHALCAYWKAHMDAEGELFGWLLTYFQPHLDSAAIVGLSVLQGSTFVAREHPGGWAGYVCEFADVDFDDHVIELFETHFYSEYRRGFPLPAEVTPPEGWYEYRFPSVPAAATVAAARTWLLNCDGGPHGRGFAADVLAALHDWQVADLLDRRYEGGWVAFVAAAGTPPEQPTTPLMTTHGAIR